MHLGLTNSPFGKTENLSMWLRSFYSLFVFVNAVDEMVLIPTQISFQIIENQTHFFFVFVLEVNCLFSQKIIKHSFMVIVFVQRPLASLLAERSHTAPLSLHTIHVSHTFIDTHSFVLLKVYVVRVLWRCIRITYNIRKHRTYYLMWLQNTKKRNRKRIHDYWEAATAYDYTVEQNE